MVKKTGGNDEARRHLGNLDLTAGKSRGKEI